MGMSTAETEARPMEVRGLAVSLFRTCLAKGMTVEEAVDGDHRAASLSSRDRALLANVLLTSFRHLGEIDAVLGKFLDKPLPRKSGPAQDILRLGVAQLLFLDMPAHAVIDLSVRAAKADRNALHFAGLVNAVLRKVSVSGKALLAALDAPRLNTPDWLWNRWVKRYGPEAARGIAIAHADRPSLDISFKDDGAAWKEALGGDILPNGQLRLAPGHAPVPELAGFREGAWWIQDAGATIPVHLLGDVKGLRVLDLCAAPGGKTLQLAALGAHVTAVDVSESRLRRLRANLARTGLEAELRNEDVLGDSLSGGWDAVLLDAPCSATGTIRRHPELPHLKQEAQVRELAGLQRRMLRKAAGLVKPGGILIYCTCSLEPEEGEAQVKSFLKADSRYALSPSPLPWLPAASLAEEGWVRTLPFMPLGNARGMDGFFVARLQRSG